jgi:hypothetical protein
MRTEFGVEMGWICPPWLQNYLRRLRHAMDEGEEDHFNLCKQQASFLMQRACNTFANILSMDSRLTWP